MTKPNIVLIMTDTQPTAFVGCYSGQEVRTPHLDKMAEEGVRFDRAYTSCPLCTPARAGIFSGMTPNRSGPYSNNLPFGANVVTMGQRLQWAGYRTGYIGKWHLDAHGYLGNGVCPPGWEEGHWYDGRRYTLELSPEEVKLWRSGLKTVADLKTHNIKSEFTWAHRICDRAERFLSEQGADRPFLLVTSFDEPHHPYVCPPQYAEPFLDFKLELGESAFDDLKNKPAHHREWSEGWLGVKEPTGYYQGPKVLGCNSYVDSQIGRVIDAARKWSTENQRPTWIIYTSDHGDHLGTHRIVSKGPSAYEYNVHIPFIVLPPDGDAAGTVQSSLVSHLDILPTMLELAGQDVPDGMDGRSFLDLIGHENTDADRAIMTEYTRFELGHDGIGGLEPLRMFVKGPWKLVINLFRTDELYNLEEDPDEINNRINDSSVTEIRDELHQSLIDWMDEHVDPQRGRAWQKREWRDASIKFWEFAPIRLHPDDGVRSPVLNYFTGEAVK